ncbi:MAG TPA: nuclear transport factor 2 family protein [Jiangellaceae bacterium]
MDVDHVRRWVDAYQEAWANNDPADIEVLFAADATYRHRPYQEPITGREAIVSDWLQHSDEPGSWRASFSPLVVHDDLAVVTGDVDYDDGDRFANLWVLRFGADGRCSEFTEWWMLKPSDQA